jgi:hypothetical protein
MMGQEDLLTIQCQFGPNDEKIRFAEFPGFGSAG